MIENKVLIVDDELHSRHIIHEYLKEFNKTSLEFANTPEQALTLCYTNLFQLIILDINLPRTNGFELAKQIHADSINGDTPFIFISAYFNDYDSMQKGYALGAVDFITKPLDEYLFKSKVKVFIKLNRQKEVIRQQREHIKQKYEELLEKEKVINSINKNLKEQVEEKTKSLNDKIGHLEATKMELLVVKNNLELIVDQRTQDLKSANKKLTEEIESRKQTQNKLIERDKELEHAQHISRVGSWRWNLNSDKVQWSNTAFSIFGLEPNQDKSISLMEILKRYVHPEDVDMITPLKDTIRRKKKSEQFEFRLVRKDGEKRYVQLMSCPVLDENRNVVAIRGTLQDITAQTINQLNLRAKEEQLKIALEAADIMVYDNYVEDGIIYISGNTEAIFGDNVKNFIKTENLKDYLNADTYLQFRKTFYQLLDGEMDSYEQEFKLVNKNQQEKYFIDRGKVIQKSTNGTVLRISGSMIDVTKARKIEQQLKQLNDHLEERVKSEIKKRENQQRALVQKSKLEALGELAAGIGHEVSHPLSVIGLTVNNILRKYGNNQTNPQYLFDKLTRIQENVDSISNIVKQIRIFSRDQKPDEPEALQINNIINQTAQLLSRQYYNHNIHFEVNLEPNLSLIMGDKNKLEQVVFNMLSNSKYAVEKKAKDLEVFGKKILVSTYQKNNRVIVDFWDNGVGIAQSDQEKIFDPFYTTKGEEGTGLGLSVVYGIVEEMNGSVKLFSEKGEYTMFRFSFPKAQVDVNKKNQMQKTEKNKVNS